MTRLEVGDYIYDRSGYSISRHQITRVTDKTAWAGNIRLPREINEKWSTKAIGSNSNYSPETPMLEEKFHRQELLSEVKHSIRHNIEKMSIGQLERISEIIKEIA